MSTNHIDKILESVNKINDAKTTKYLSDDDKEFIHQIFSNKSFLTELGSLIDEIYNDGKIDHHDIPTIMLFLVTVFKNYIWLNKDCAINYLDIIKYIIECIVFTVNPIVDLHTILLINKVIETSLTLLKFEFNHLNKVTISCNCGFKRLTNRLCCCFRRRVIRKLPKAKSI